MRLAIPRQFAGAARPEAPRGAARRFAAIAPAALAVGLAGFAGHLASGVEGDGQAGEMLAAGGVRLAAPEGWRVERPAAARAPDGNGRAVVRTLPGVVFAHELAPGQPDAVRLGDLEAYRWRGETTMIAAPTSRGVAVVACSGPARAVRQCERAAATLESPRAKPTSLDTLGFYASHLHAAIERLERRRAAAARANATAAALRARTAYEAAARSLSDLAPPAAAAAANQELVTTLREIGAAYEGLARAARRGRRPAYAAAARAATRREAALRAVLAGMAPPAG
jgi:hypothetical protein